ncbi:hypothetical protein [Pseudomonas fluorescens]|nr:hypothetical protein [Pseudomonas fluorescens]
MRRLPSLAALRTFECAARHAHFGRAAAFNRALIRAFSRLKSGL